MRSEPACCLLPHQPTPRPAQTQYRQQRQVCLVGCAWRQHQSSADTEERGGHGEAGTRALHVSLKRFARLQKKVGSKVRLYSRPTQKHRFPLALCHRETWPAMEDEGGAISQLGDLALGNILTDLGIASDGSNVPHLVSGGQGQSKAARASQLFERDQIYNDRFEDDEDADVDFGDLPGAAEDDDARAAAEEDKAARDRYYRMGLASLEKSKSKGAVRGEDDDFDEDSSDKDAAGKVDDDRPLVQVKEEPTNETARSTPSSPLVSTPPPSQASAALPQAQPLDVKELWPGFQPGKVLDFTELFTTRPPKRRRMQGRIPEVKGGTRPTPPAPRSTRDELVTPAGPLMTRSHQLARELAEPIDSTMSEERRADLSIRSLVRPQARLNLLSLDDWEERIYWGADEEGDVATNDEWQKPPPVNIQRPYNHELDAGDWVNGIIWGGGAKHKDYTQLILDLNDPEMMLEMRTDEQEKISSLVRMDAPAISSRAMRAAAGLDPFNLSNDRFYEQSKEHRMRSIRQTLGQLELQHSWPATKLQLPFYKTRLTKTEARDFHRPGIQFPSNVPLRFSKVRKEKRRKDESRPRSKKDVSQLLRSTRDLTLKDTSPFVLYEYSEEYPPVMSNLGMGSLLVNYYRKRDARDEHIPKLDLGEGVVLDVQDESPFMKFGSVEPGRTQPTLYNRMVRAPLFRHKAAQTDFLLIRSTTKNEVRYYLRDIRNLFAVGQTYPLVPVPGPHARLVTNALKYRMQLIAYKLLEKSIGERIKIHKIMKYFPDQNELQMRQRMKEFMEYHRRDKDQGFWKLKPDHVPPTEADLQSKLPPEHVCLIEAMQAGQRHLLDAGYTKTAEGYDDENQDESKMDIEQLLAPWITTKNFLHATQGKAMLKLYGEGDPSGRGEAFSFLRVSMKDVFIRAGETEEERMAMQQLEEEKSGHKYNVARQQAVYRSEVQRIWNTQRKALENPIPPEMTMEEREAVAAAAAADDAAANTNERRQHARSLSRAQSLRRDSPSGSQVGTPGAGDDSESAVDSNKVLRIRRFKNARWTTEVVREHSVIHAYIRQRQRIEDERTATEALLPTGDATLDAARRRRLEEEIKSSLKNRDRRLQRKNAKALAEGIPIEGGAQKLLNKTDTKRRCGRCGQVGHMMTNTSCPEYKAAENPANATTMQGIPSTSSSAAAAAGPPGGQRSSMLPGASWYGSSAGGPHSVPQSPMTPLGGGSASFAGTPGTPGGAAAEPSPSAAGDAASPPAGQPSSKIKLKIKR